MKDRGVLFTITLIESKLIFVQLRSGFVPSPMANFAPSPTRSGCGKNDFFVKHPTFISRSSNSVLESNALLTQ